MKCKDFIGFKDQQSCAQKPVQSLRDRYCAWYYAETTFVPFHLVFSLNKFKDNTDKMYLQKCNET